jgi:hypothetical protein
MEEIREGFYKLQQKHYKIKQLYDEIDKLKSDVGKKLYQYIYVTDSDTVLESHKHYTENHRLSVNKERYIDWDWYKDTYGSRAVCDKYGRTLPYKGPDQSIMIVCERCDKSAYAFTREEENNVDVQKAFDKVLLDEVYYKYRNEHLDNK